MTVRCVSNNPSSPFYNANAPNLTGQVGSLTALLDAVLVNGFTGFTALGWSIGFTTTNKRAYLQNLTGANNPSGMYLYVDDTGPGAGGAREARVCGFETMSAITPTGTGQFPTNAQSAIGVGTLVIRKSSTADATTRFWTLCGNGQTFYLWTETGDFIAPALAAFSFFFGDFRSYRPSDQYAVAIIGRDIENNPTSSNEAFMICGPNINMTLAAKTWGHYAARSWTGLGSAIQFNKTMDWGSLGQFPLAGWNGDSATNIGGSTNLMPGRNAMSPNQWPAPNGADGSIFLSPLWINHSWSRRGYLPGIWVPMHDRPLSHNDAITIASGNLNGKSLLCQQLLVYLSGNDYGNILVETSDTWF
jgi:hypothetical protein